MERLPTETDLLRLCDAAAAFHAYYRAQVCAMRGMVQDIDEHLSELQRLVAVIPCPKWFFFSFDSVGRPHDEPATPWRGWEPRHWQRFIELIEVCRELVLRWHLIKTESIDELKPLQRVGNNASSNTLQLVDQLFSAAEALRSECAFVPNEVQKDILEKLRTGPKTADELEAECIVSRNRLYGLRNAPSIGGLNELVRLGLVAQRAGIRGYFRSDMPPK